jgi:30S ribosomal protein S31
MGKGDQRSKRGKIHRGTFGKRRPKPKTHRSKLAADAAAEAAGAAPASKEKTKEPKVVKKQPKE